MSLDIVVPQIKHSSYFGKSYDTLLKR